MPETTPLLPFITPSRKHFLDNLRATLTVLLVIHHAVIETAIATRIDTTLLSVFVAANKAFLWSTFFFVSGYSTSLSLSSRSSNLKVFVNKTRSVTAPAVIYALVGHLALYYFLSTNWEYIFGGPRDVTSYARLSGPVIYVFLLFLFDASAMLIRQISFPSWMNPDVTHNVTILIALVVLAGYTFVNAAFIVPNINRPSFLGAISYDTPNPSFPLSHVIAYAAGWQFKSFKRTILSSSTNSALFGLFSSIILSYGSLAYAQYKWPALSILVQIHAHATGGGNSVFIDGGFNAHTIFFAIWSTFTFFTIPVCLLSAFFHGGVTSRSWGLFGRKTYVQTYVHMIPILVAEYHLRRVKNVWVMYTLVIFVGVVGTWLMAAAIYTIVGYAVKGYKEAKRRMRW